MDLLLILNDLAAGAENTAQPEKKVDAGPVKADVKGAKSKQPKKQEVDPAASKVKADQEGKKAKAPINPQEKMKAPKTSKILEL